MKRLEGIAFVFWPFLVVLVTIVAARVNGTSLTISAEWYDTAYYLKIIENGYTGKLENAFFPGFPFFWKMLGGALQTICIVNLAMWLLSMWLLKRFTLISPPSLLLSTILPSSLFLMLPYSESLFFLASVLVAIGLFRDDLRLTIIGVLFATLIRPTASVVIIALFAARWAQGLSWRASMARSLIEGLTGLIGLLLVFAVQYLEGGEWVAFFEAQAAWGNGFSMPNLPLSSWGGDVITVLDGTALFIGLMGLLSLFRCRRNAKLNELHYFGFAGMAITALLILFTRNGMLFSLNRFIFATAFLPLALDGWRRLEIKGRERFALVAVWLLFSLGLGSYLHLKAILIWIGIGGLLALGYGALNNRRLMWTIAVFCGVLVSWFALNFYLEGKWIG